MVSHVIRCELFFKNHASYYWNFSYQKTLTAAIKRYNEIYKNFINGVSIYPGSLLMLDQYIFLRSQQFEI